VALLAAHRHLRDAEDEAAVGVGDGVPLEDAQDGDPPGDPGAGLHGHRPALHIRHQLRQVGRQPVRLHRERQPDLAVALAGDAARVDGRLADVRAAVGEVGVAPGVVGEGGRVRVVHGHGEQQRDVELEGDGREGEARGDARQARGDEARGGVPDLEDGGRRRAG